MNKMRAPLISVGTDPEIFAFVKDTLVPAPFFLPSKHAAKLIDGHKLYWDGFQAEIAFEQGQTCLEGLLSNIQKALYTMQQKLIAKYPKANLSTINVTQIPDDLMAKAPQHIVDFGCMPSFNVYGDKGETIDDPRNLKWRFAGGHKHFSPLTWDAPLDKRKVARIIKTLDAIYGVWSVGAAQAIDNPIRRKHYGLAGEFRTPKYANARYGLEYRVPSNFWLASPVLAHMSWELARQAFRVGMSPTLHKNWMASEEEVKKTINNCDVALAQKILRRNRDFFGFMMSSSRKASGYTSLSNEGQKLTYQVGQEGYELICKKDEIVKTWELESEPNIVASEWTKPYTVDRFVGIF